MPDNRNGGGREAVVVSTTKVYDSCRSQDCLEDLRCYLTEEGQTVLDRAIGVKPRTASILWTYLDVEPVPFNGGFYAVDAHIFYRITVDCQCGLGRPTEIEGLCVCDKRAILFGSEGRSRSFSSRYVENEGDVQLPASTNLPTATIELVDPVVLSARMAEPCDPFRGSDCCGCGCGDVPPRIAGCFGGPIRQTDVSRRLYVTLGQFSLVRLERRTQLMLPSCDYCIPEKECPPTAEGDACEAFSRFRFPTGEFFPPDERPGR